MQPDSGHSSAFRPESSESEGEYPSGSAVTLSECWFRQSIYDCKGIQTPPETGQENAHNPGSISLLTKTAFGSTGLNISFPRDWRHKSKALCGVVKSSQCVELLCAGDAPGPGDPAVLDFVKIQFARMTVFAIVRSRPKFRQIIMQQLLIALIRVTARFYYGVPHPVSPWRLLPGSFFQSPIQRGRST